MQGEVVGLERKRHSRRRLEGVVGLVRVLVGSAVTIVVQAVKDLFRARICFRFRIIAIAFAGGIEVPIDIITLVDEAITVVVQVVAHLFHSRVDVPVVIIAVISTRSEAILVDIVALVDTVIAVVIHGVADLGGARIDRAIEIVAVTRSRGIVIRLGTEAARTGGVAIAIAVLVGVIHCPLSPRIIVDFAIAVIVDPVAQFGRSGIAGRVAVVAVTEVGDVTAWGCAGALHPFQGAVAIAVVVRIPGPDFVRVEVPIVAVHQPVAVIVQPITDLFRAGIDLVVIIVTVAIHIRQTSAAAREILNQQLGRAVAIQIGIHVAGLESITVLIDSIRRNLSSQRIDVWVAVVTVARY